MAASNEYEFSDDEEMEMGADRLVSWRDQPIVIDDDTQHLEEDEQEDASISADFNDGIEHLRQLIKHVHRNFLIGPGMGVQLNAMTGHLAKFEIALQRLYAADKLHKLS